MRNMESFLRRDGVQLRLGSVPNSAKQFVDTSQSALHPKPGRHVDIFEVYSHEGEVFCLFFLTVLNAKSPRGRGRPRASRAEVGGKPRSSTGTDPRSRHFYDNSLPIFFHRI